MALGTNLTQNMNYETVNNFINLKYDSQIGQTQLEMKQEVRIKY